MRADLLGVDAPQWEDFLADVPHDFYHLPAYVALCAAQENGEPCALYVRDAGRAMLLPLVVRPIPGGGRDAASPYGYPGPLLSGPEDPLFLYDAFVAGAQMLWAEQMVSLFVRFHPLLNDSPPDGMGTVVQHGETVSIDLTLEPEALWRQTMSGHRNEINRALKAGHKAFFDDTWEHYGAFKRLYGGTMERRNAAEHYRFDDVYFDGLRAALGEKLHLCVVDIGGAVAAAGLFVETCGIVQYHLSGSDDAFARESPAKLMIHFVRDWAKARGDIRMHLGGGVGAADDSLLRFKAGFSPLRRPFYTLRIVLLEDEYERLVAARDPSLHPALPSDFFPLYRKT